MVARSAAMTVESLEKLSVYHTVALKVVKMVVSLALLTVATMDVLMVDSKVDVMVGDSVAMWVASMADM